jgi:hypothetical protein
MEVYLGLYAMRLPPVSETVTLKSIPDKNISAYCRKFITQLEPALREFERIGHGHAQLSHILEDMIADINRFMYLASFK